MNLVVKYKITQELSSLGSTKKIIALHSFPSSKQNTHRIGNFNFIHKLQKPGF